MISQQLANGESIILARFVASTLETEMSENWLDRRGLYRSLGGLHSPRYRETRLAQRDRFAKCLSFYTGPRTLPAGQSMQSVWTVFSNGYNGASLAISHGFLGGAEIDRIAAVIRRNIDSLGVCQHQSIVRSSGNGDHSAPLFAKLIKIEQSATTHVHEPCPTPIATVARSTFTDCRFGLAIPAPVNSGHAVCVGIGTVAA